MKKRIIATFMTLVILVSTASVVLAAGGVELPMIPIGSTTVVNVKLSSDADEFVYNGGSVKYTTEISDVGADGLSRADLEYTYSDGLIFGDDIKVIGLPDGWTVGQPAIGNNKLVFSVFDETGENHITGRNLDITFSFTVATVSGSQQSVNLTSVILKDKRGITIAPISKRVTNNTFVTEASIPMVKNIGASLRINNTPAMRLGMTVAKDERFHRAFPDGFKPDNADMKFGMLIIEKSKLVGELTMDTRSATSTVFTEEFSSTNNEIVFVHTLSNLTDYKKDYVFRPFVMYRESSDSEYKYHYGETKTRSAKTVAELELLSEVSTKKIELLKKFVK